MELENKNCKDTVFRRLYSNKNRLLELYNAINNTNYTNPDEIIIKTLKGNTFLGMKNDISFILDYEINLYEHNSTPCPNIALRDLFYIASSYKKIVPIKDTYKSTAIKIPTPRFFVFYNGSTPLPDSTEYRLSDMFIKSADSPSLELKVTVLNVNEGRNEKLMESCKTLKEYSIFVSKVRKYTQEIKMKNTPEVYSNNKKQFIREAVTKAIDECIAEDILRDFFVKNRQEAIDMSTLECTAEEYYQVVATESYDSGYGNGYADGTKIITDLFSWLKQSGRQSDINKALDDPEYLKKLIDEFKQS